MRLAVPLLLLAAMLAPGAAAFDLAPSRIEARELQVDGAGRFVLSSGVASLFPADDARDLPTLRWSAATGHVTEKVSTRTNGNPTLTLPPLGEDAPTNESLTMDEGRLSQVVCRAGCRVLVGWSEGGALAELTGALEDARLAPSAQKRVYAAGTSESDPTYGGFDGVRYEVAAGHLAFGAEGIAVQDAMLVARGPLTLTVFNATVVLETREGRRTVHTGVFDEPEDVLGASPSRQHTVRFLHLALAEGSLEDPRASAAAVHAPSAAFALDGRLVAPSATGEIAHGRGTSRVTREELILEGTVVGTLRGNAPAAGILGAPEPTLSYGFEGDVQSLSVAGQGIRTTPEASTLAGGLTLLAALAALAWWSKASLQLLYSRIADAALLENENRAAIARYVLAHPGVSTQDVARGLGLRETLVSYHARILVQRSRLQRREVAGAQLLFPPGVPERALAPATERVLRSRARRRVAEALPRIGDAAPAPTQRALAETLGMSQRLVSYHLAVLRREGLVAPEGANPTVYRSTGTLAKVPQQTGRPAERSVEA